MTSSDWKEEVVAAAARRAAGLQNQRIEPFEVRTHRTAEGQFAVEMRPRGGTWIPADERDRCQPSGMTVGPRGMKGWGGMIVLSLSDPEIRGPWWVQYCYNDVTPATSAYLFCKVLPSEVLFGVPGSDVEMYRVSPLVEPPPPEAPAAARRSPTGGSSVVSQFG